MEPQIIMTCDISGCQEQYCVVDTHAYSGEKGAEAVWDASVDAQDLYPWAASEEVDELALVNFHARVDREIASLWACGPAIDGLLRGVRLVLTHHRIPSPVLQLFCDQATAYLTCTSESVFIARAKFLLCAPMAAYLKNDSPPAPDIVFVVRGQVRRWFRSRFSFCAKNTHLWWSFYQAKRACLEVSEQYVHETYAKHRRQMAAPDPIDDATLELVMNQLEPVLSAIRGQLDGVGQSSGLVGTECDFRPLPDVPHQASHSACYEASRSRGGQAGHLERKCFGDEPVPHGYELSRMQWYPQVVVNGRWCYNIVVCFYVPCENRLFLESIADDEERVREGHASHDESGVRLPCMIQGVIEPLKVRVISKGPAAPYYLAKQFQKRLHSIMRRMDCFRLIGRPLSPTDLLDLDEHSVRLRMFEGRSWFSIDYSAATDGLSARLSASILRSIIPSDVSDFERDRLLSVLAPHRCEYPPKSGLDPVDERNGQLMGSILSFPILCLANLGLYLAVIRNDSRGLAQKLRGVLVNGDDMLYVAPPSLYDEHATLGRRVGLELSVGKSYVHSSFASANSTCFHCPLDQKPRFNGPRRADDVRQINFLNSGLFFGSSKVMRVSTIDGDDVTTKSALTILGALLDGCWSARQEKDLAKMYFAYHKERITAEAAGRNYFIHPSLGGCGARVPDGWSWSVSTRHQAIALDRIARLSTQQPGADPIDVEFAVFGPRVSPELPDLFTHATPAWSPVPDREPLPPARWPAVVLSVGGVPTQVIPGGRLLSKVRLCAGIVRSRPRGDPGRVASRA